MHPPARPISLYAVLRGSLIHAVLPKTTGESGNDPGVFADPNNFTCHLIYPMGNLIRESLQKQVICIDFRKAMPTHAERPALRRYQSERLLSVRLGNSSETPRGAQRVQDFLSHILLPGVRKLLALAAHLI
jgi:hypothetical protein